MATQIPDQYKNLVEGSAASLGIPYQVVAEQINLESGWDPNAVSPTGAQGLAQFEPGTWAEYGPTGGSPFDPSSAFTAYIKYMHALLKQEGGDLRKALEAYNAGPGNLPAGAGYADTILTRAGTGDVQQGTAQPGPDAGAQGPTGINKLLSDLNPLSGIATAIGAVFGPITSAFQEFYKGFAIAMHAVVWLVNPSNWVRIIAGLVGTVSLIVGLVFVARAA